MDDQFILVADDNELTRQLYTSVIEAAGYKVMQALDGSTALKVVHDFPVLAGIVDQYMSPMSGTEFASMVKSSSGPKPPLIMVTANDTTDLLATSHELGFQAVMQKPIDPKRLVSTVERLIERSKR